MEKKKKIYAYVGLTGPRSSQLVTFLRGKNGTKIEDTVGKQNSLT